MSKQRARGAAIKGRPVKSQARKRTLFARGAANPGHSTRRKETGAYRAPGTPNKITRDIRQAIVNTLFDRLKGEEYLKKLGVREPKAFAALIGKAMPLQLEGGDGKPLAAPVHLTVKFVDPKEKS